MFLGFFWWHLCFDWSGHRATSQRRKEETSSMFSLRNYAPCYMAMATHSRWTNPQYCRGPLISYRNKKVLELPSCRVLLATYCMERKTMCSVHFSFTFRLIPKCQRTNHATSPTPTQESSICKHASVHGSLALMWYSALRACNISLHALRFVGSKPMHIQERIDRAIQSRTSQTEVTPQEVCESQGYYQLRLRLLQAYLFGMSALHCFEWDAQNNMHPHFFFLQLVACQHRAYLWLRGHYGHYVCLLVPS